jgi:hypothetical protein
MRARARAGDRNWRDLPAEITRPLRRGRMFGGPVNAAVIALGVASWILVFALAGAIMGQGR